MKRIVALTSLALVLAAPCMAQNLHEKIDQETKEILPKVIEWRRYIHQHPELSNREYNTSKYVADYLKSLGLEVQTGIAKTGVVAILKGGKPGPCIGLRADMDALPIREITNVPFASTARGLLVGDSVWVMHACGHDAHTAMLLGAATVLSSMKKDIAGTVKFIFQPSEEGPPTGEEGGASVMVKEGVMENPKVDAIYGMHMNPKLEGGSIQYRSGAIQASSDWITINVKGKGSHGAQPWNGVDPIVISAQIIQALQTIVSRQEDLTKAPVVITIGKINGGVRNNVIPDEVVMEGTVRALDESMRLDILERIKRIVESTAKMAGGSAELSTKTIALVNYNDPNLMQKSLPFMRLAAGADRVKEMNWATVAEDFSFYGTKAPSCFFFLGGLPKEKKPEEASTWHTPDFYIDDSILDVGVKTFCYLVMDYGQK